LFQENELQVKENALLVKGRDLEEKDMASNEVYHLDSLGLVRMRNGLEEKQIKQKMEHEMVRQEREEFDQIKSETETFC
jgi:hypothetical protein